MAVCDYYLTTEWHEDQGDQAILVSPMLGQSATNCYLTYDIQIDGPNITLEMFVKPSTGDARSIARIGQWKLQVPRRKVFKSVDLHYVNDTQFKFTEIL